MSVGFDRSRDRRQRVLTNNKNIKGESHIRIFLKKIFGFAEHQEKTNYGLGSILTLTRNIDGAVFNKENAINNAKIIINSIHWYVPHYRPSIDSQTILFKQAQSKTHRELQYSERSIFIKQVNTQNLWTFELGTQKSINVPKWIFAGFQQMDRKNSENLNNDSFYRPPVTSAHVVISSERYLDNSLSLDHDDDDYSQGYGQIKEAFKALTKDAILQPCISENDFGSSIDGDNIGYGLYAFDIR